MSGVVRGTFVFHFGMAFCKSGARLSGYGCVTLICSVNQVVNLSL